MFGKWSNMAHAKNYFREKNSVFLRLFGLQSGEYSKIISERMKGTTILVWSGDYIVCTVGYYEIQLYIHVTLRTVCAHVLYDNVCTAV